MATKGSAFAIFGDFTIMAGPDNGNLTHNRGCRSMLSDVSIHVKFKLSALWVAVMLCYIYGDLFGFFQQKTVAAIVAGNAGIIGTQTGLLAAASMMAVPSVMVFLSLVLPPRVSRWINVVLGLAFTGIIIATMPGSWMFYKFLGIVEAALTLTIVWYALRWPEQEPREPPILN